MRDKKDLKTQRSTRERKIKQPDWCGIRVEASGCVKYRLSRFSEQKMELFRCMIAEMVPDRYK